MAASGKDTIESIRLQSDIVEVIGRYVPLKRAGGSRFKGLCPFHKEKTPSFQVDQDKQLFHCFGCGAGGDVFSFMMQYERVEFLDAARLLADRAGIAFDPAPGEASAGPREKTDKAALYRMHEQLADFYAAALKSSAAAQSVRDYLTERDLEAAAVDFQLGWAPTQANAMVTWAQKKNFPLPLLAQAGILLPADREGAPPYDRFKGRLMFPIRDEQGRVVAFSGRILDQSSPAKYVNSPETPLFRKGRVLYGLDRARQPMVDQRSALLCEGQIDVIRCHLAGLPTAVAPQGTAMTEGHAALLKRYADEIIIMFDGDTAGQNATLRAAEVLLAAGLTVRVAALPPGEDPDSLVRKEGAEALQQRVAQAQSLVEAHLDMLAARGEFNSQAGQLRTAKAVLELILHAPSAIQREQYLKELSARLQISESALKQDMMKMVRPTRYDPESEKQSPKQEAAHPPHEVALLELMIAHPEALDLVAQYVEPETITDPVCRRIIQLMLTQPEPDPTALLQSMADEGEQCRRLHAKLIMTARTVTSEEISSIHAVQDVILALRIKQLDREIKSCLEKSERAGEVEKKSLINESAQLTYLKKKMQQGWEAARPILER